MRNLRFLILLLILITFLILAPACTSTDSTAPRESIEEDLPGESQASSEEFEEESVETTEEGVVESEAEEESIEVDKGLFSVEITLPASFFEGEDIDEVAAKKQEDGIGEVKVNEDGSITYKMSKSKHNELMREMRDDLIEYIEEIKNNEDYESIEDITYNKAFSEITLLVDQEKFDNSFDGFVALGLGITSSYYQIFNGISPDKYKVTIFFKDANTEEVLHSVVYPDAFEEID